MGQVDRALRREGAERFRRVGKIHEVHRSDGWQGRQIVLTSDRPPSEIDDVDDRLINRISGGLIVDISPPDFETRVAILRRLCAERTITFKEGMLEELARFEFANVREMQGAFNRLVAHQAICTVDEPPKVRGRSSRAVSALTLFSQWKLSSILPMCRHLSRHVAML